MIAGRGRVVAVGDGDGNDGRFEPKGDEDIDSVQATGFDVGICDRNQQSVTERPAWHSLKISEREGCLRTTTESTRPEGLCFHRKAISQRVVFASASLTQCTENDDDGIDGGNR